MSLVHHGGCLCGEVRYRTTAKPVRVTISHCTFCQRMTGSAYLVEPIADPPDAVGLRTGCERQSCSRNSNHRDELAPSMHLPPTPCNT